MTARQEVHVARAEIPARERLIFAMDVPRAGEARRLADRLGDSIAFYKLGLELFMSGGAFELLDWMVGRGKKVFLDLKLFDVPATVASAVRNLRNRGVTFTTVHGNQAIMEAAAEAADGVGILAVTVLTSLDRGDLDDLGFRCDVEALVLSRARRALAAGCAGVVSSGLEATVLRQGVDDRLIVVTPGIRPVENRPVDDQKRVVGVAEAFAKSAVPYAPTVEVRFLNVAARLVQENWGVALLDQLTASSGRYARGSSGRSESSPTSSQALRSRLSSTLDRAADSSVSQESAAMSIALMLPADAPVTATRRGRRRTSASRSRGSSRNSRTSVQFNPAS